MYTLECLVAFTQRYGTQLVSNAGSISQEVAPMISEEDLQRSVVALQVSSNIITINKSQPQISQTLSSAI